MVSYMFLVSTVLLEYSGVPEQMLGWSPVDVGLILEDEPSELLCSAVSYVLLYFSRLGTQLLCVLLKYMYVGVPEQALG